MLPKRIIRPGSVTVHAAVTMSLLLSVLALTLDGGALFAERRHAQATADAAALAAACELYEGYWTNGGDDGPGTAKASALRAAAANGYKDDGKDSKVMVRIPPTSGHYIGRRGYAEVVVEYYQRRSFSSLFSSEPITVRARAVAIGSPIAADVGILVLEPTEKAAFNAQGSGKTTVNGTPIVVNSNHTEAAIAGGGGSVAADKFNITGGYTTTGGGTFIGPIYTGRPRTEDPLAYLPPPSPGGLLQRSTRKVQETSGDVYLSPGVYTGGINVSGTASLYLQPGVYYMDQGGFSFSGQGSLVGKGVLIYTQPGSGNADGISVAGQGTLDVSGMTSGPYQGITFWQERSSKVTGNVSGAGGNTNITGTFYFAGALLNIKGNGGVANMGSQYISNTLQLGGNGDININWQPDKVGRKRSIFLVE